MIKHCYSAYVEEEVVAGDCDHGTTEQERKSVAVSSNAWPGVVMKRNRSCCLIDQIPSQSFYLAEILTEGVLWV